MTSRPLRRVYKMRALTATLLCLPAILIALWYTWNAYERFNAARRVEEDKIDLTLELFHIHLHDVLARDLRRINMGPPPDPSKLDVFTFHIDQEELDTLQEGRSKTSGRDYAKAKLEYKDRVEKVELRLRGQRYWHMGREQKSLKIRLPKGELIKGYRIFNLINDPSPMVVGEQLILDLARDSGILTPLSSFARVRLNATDMGVYHYEAQPDESLLRTNRRVPASIYSGDLTSNGDSWELWKSTKPWKKPAARTDEEQVKQDFTELERLLKQVREATHAEFADFVRHEIDVAKVATFDAIDIAFGGDQHNFRQNQKYTFDPYRGRWEPIAWSFEGFRDDPYFNQVDYPLLLRLKLTPGYLTKRDRRLYELLVNEASFPALERRGAEALRRLAPELRTDPFWDSYHLLTKVDTYHRQLVRPMTIAKAVMVFESELTTYQRRSRQLLSELVKNPLFGRWSSEVAPTESAQATAGARQVHGNGDPPHAREPKPKSQPEPALASGEAKDNADWVRSELELFIDGRVGVAVERLVVTLPEACPAELRLLRGDEVLGKAERGGRVELVEPLDLFPTVHIVEHNDPGSKEGPIRALPTVERYPLTLESSCAPKSIEVQGVHLATGARLSHQPVTEELLARVPASRSRPGDKIRFEPGEVAPHAWDLKEPSQQNVTLGPGEVSIASTKVFGREQVVSVAPGTRLKMAPGASLIFLGRAVFNGTRLEPIVVERAANKPWGGIALQGDATAGSQFRHVTVSGGTTPAWRLVSYPAMLNIHDTRDIAIEHCHFRENSGQADMAHITYVDDLRISDTRMTDASRDGWDLEFTNASMQRVSVVNVGDDAIDLMGAKLVVRDSVIVGALGNGVSAGEETDVDIEHSIIADAKVGVLAKNASRADLFGTVLFRTDTGVRVYERTVRYEGESEVKADFLFAIQTKKKVVKRHDRKKNRLDYGRARSGFPPPGVLESLLRDVVKVGSWRELETWARAQRGGSVL